MNKFQAVATGFVACGAVVALAACGGGSATPASSSSATVSNAIVSVYEQEPQNPLIPSNTNEQNGYKVVLMLFSGLEYFDAKGSVHNDMAQSITTTDNVHFDIKLVPGNKFSDGEAVDADSFINAWNYGAYGPNSQLLNYFFSPIEGYNAMNPTAQGAKPTAQTLTGLKKLSDTEFTVTLTQPMADFPLQLGYMAFDPLPASAFKDMKAFGQQPIGNGPYKMAPNGWQHNQQISLTANGKSAGAEGYQGPRQPMNGGLKYVVYQSTQSAYSDVESNQLDVMEAIPESNLATYKTDPIGGGYNGAGGTYQGFAIPMWLPVYQGQAGVLRREAISEAIDRVSICKTILANTCTPAKDFTSPVIAGWTANLTGNEVLNYNPSDAKAKWAQANAMSPLPADYVFSIAYNADGGIQQWIQAIVNSVSQTLNVKSTMTSIPTYSQFLTEGDKPGAFQVPFRTRWLPDYPGMYDYLALQYGSGSSANQGAYSNPAFDKLLVQAQSTTDASKQAAFFTQAQELLIKDLPDIPLWYQNTQGVWSTSVSDVTFGWDGEALFWQITKK